MVLCYRVTIHGFSVHPGSAKDAMINASNVAMEFHMASAHRGPPRDYRGLSGFLPSESQMYGDHRGVLSHSADNAFSAEVQEGQPFSTSPATSTASAATGTVEVERSRTATAICWKRSSPTSTLWRRPARPSRLPA